MQLDLVLAMQGKGHERFLSIKDPHECVEILIGRQPSPMDAVLEMSLVS